MHAELTAALAALEPELGRPEGEEHLTRVAAGLADPRCAWLEDARGDRS